MTPFAIAGIQMHLSATESNVDHMCRKLDLLMYLYPWVQMVMFSELAPFGPIVQRAQSMPGPAEEAFRAAAARHKVWLLPGSLFERRGAKIYNTAPVIDPGGNVIARYSKMFLFLPYEEGVEAGDEFVVFDVPEVGRFGVSICYDMWFPETSRTLVAKGAEVILHPSLTSTIDRPVELSIAVTTAAVNQCFVFDVNGLGAGGTGRSIVVGPAGDVLHQSGGAEEMIPIEIDLDRVRRSREVGLRGLGQPLKSFRDRKVDFKIYSDRSQAAYLETLGPLEKAQRGSRAGLESSAVERAVLESRGLEPESPVEAALGAPEDPYLPPIAGADLPAGVSLPLPEIKEDI